MNILNGPYNSRFSEAEARLRANAITSHNVYPIQWLLPFPKEDVLECSITSSPILNTQNNLPLLPQLLHLSPALRTQNLKFFPCFRSQLNCIFSSSLSPLPLKLTS